MSDNFTHNAKIRKEYWKNFDGKSVPICQNAVCHGQWKTAFKNAIYHKSSNERYEALLRLVQLYMSDVVDHIFQHRRAFRESTLPENISIPYPICTWMEKSSLRGYRALKKHIANELKDMAKSGQSTENDIKTMIASTFAIGLESTFIRL